MLDLVLNIQAFEQAVRDIPSPSPVHIALNPCDLLKLSLMLLIAIHLKQFASMFSHPSTKLSSCFFSQKFSSCLTGFLYGVI